jgi:hypothetical protein
MKAGPVRDYAAPGYATGTQSAAELQRSMASPRPWLTHRGVSLGLVVAAATACASACTVGHILEVMTEAEALDIIALEFARSGIDLERPVGPGEIGLPFTPDLASWELGIIVEFTDDSGCGDQVLLAEGLLEQGDALCGLVDTAEPEDTSDGDDTGEPAPEDPRDALEALCRAELNTYDCGSSTPPDALEACLRYGCFEVHALALYSQGEKYATSDYLHNEIGAFIARLRAQGALPPED